jgi:capsular polysaccharide biosynthesis protein
MGSEFIREQLVFVLDVIRRRWYLLCLPVVVAAAIAYFAIQFAPTKFHANSLILLQGANRGDGPNSVQRSTALEQIGAVEAWLKSDQVLATLLPQILGDKMPKTPDGLAVQMALLRNALTLELVGGSVLEVELTGNNPHGLGRNLEIILTRLMEGLTGPEQNIFSASQFVLMRRNEEMAAADKALVQAIAASGAQAPQQVRAELRQLWQMTQNSKARVEAGSASATLLAGAQADEAADRLRRAISNDPKTVETLEKAYATYQNAEDRFTALQAQGAANRSNYVGIFASPDNLLVIGRPKDPLVGESSVRKLAIAGILMSLIGGTGIVFLAELLDGRVRTRREHEVAAGLPVVARMAKVRPQRAARA